MAKVPVWATLSDVKHFDGTRPSLDDFEIAQEGSR